MNPALEAAVVAHLAPLTSDLVEVVFEQLPKRLRECLNVTVTADAYRLKVVATFIEENGTQHDCLLEHEYVSGTVIACRVPELFIAKLCAIVP